jgi:hypothetical protein
MDKQLEARDLDVLVIRELSGLASLAPSRGFGDRVMARVRLPQPAAVVLLHRAGAWVLQPRRAVALATAYAVCVAVALRLAVPWFAAHASAISLGTSWVAERAGALFDGATLAVASWAVRAGVTEAVRSAASAGPRLWLAVAALTIGYAVCGYGLHMLLKTPRRSDVRLVNSL